MKYQILFYGKNKKQMINLSFAESVHSVVSINFQMSVIKCATKLCFSWTLDLFIYLPFQ